MNIQNMIDNDKKNFFIKLKEPKLFKKYHSHSALVFFISGIFSTIFYLGLLLQVLPRVFPHDWGINGFIASMLLVFILCCCLSVLTTVSITHKYSNLKYKFLKKNENKMNSFISENFEYAFFDQTLSDEIKNKIRIDFSMSEYKLIHSLAKESPNITYRELIHFLNNREAYREKDEILEDDKLNISLSMKEINSYQKNTA